MHINMINYYRETFGGYDVKSGVLTKTCGTGVTLGSPCFYMKSTSYTNTKIGHLSQVPFLAPNGGMTTSAQNQRAYSKDDKRYKEVGDTVIFNDRCKHFVNDCDLLQFVINVKNELEEYRAINFSFSHLKEKAMKKLMSEINEVIKLITDKYKIIESYFTGPIQDIPQHHMASITFFRLEDIIPIWTKDHVEGFGMEVFLRPEVAQGVMFIMPSISEGVVYIDGENIYERHCNWKIKDIYAEAICLKDFMNNANNSIVQERAEIITEKIDKGE